MVRILHFFFFFFFVKRDPVYIQINNFFPASVVAFTSGVHYGWTGPSLRKILSPEYPHEVSSDEASYIAVVSCIGHVIGGFSGSSLSDAIGRKYTLLSIAVPQVTSFIMIYFSYYGKYLLYLARVLGRHVYSNGNVKINVRLLLQVV